MRTVTLLGILLVAFLLLHGAGHAASAGVTMQDVAADLICQCGCNKVLAICEMQGWAVPAKALITEKLAAGQTKEQIIAYFVDQYGAKILAAPPKRGFDLTAWVTPFAVLVGAGFLLSSVLFLWSNKRRRESPDASPKASTTELQEAHLAMYRQRLQEELHHLDY
ncbi:MAG: cytochrome c-type biogenesis protein CcmH [Candidatus Tectomicrobia bacterium]|nr:cytochrome c-type biogenesis protein CcmH [Candidatus Tectomicrobia bacterium]